MEVWPEWPGSEVILVVNWSRRNGVIVGEQEELHQRRRQKGQIVLRSAQGPNETVGVDTIDAEGGGRVRRRYDVLKERDSARNPTLLDVELMDCAACLDIDVPGRDGLEMLIRWNFLSHNWVSAQGFSCPRRKANHPMKP